MDVFTIKNSGKSFMLNIDNFEGKVVTRSYKIYEDVQKEFAEFCASSKYRVQDILTQAIKEFLEKYK